MSAPELLPCPFCASGAVVLELTPDLPIPEMDTPFVQCDSESCTAGVWGSTAEEAVRLWNTRTIAKQELEAIRAFVERVEKRTEIDYTKKGWAFAFEDAMKAELAAMEKEAE